MANQHVNKVQFGSDVLIDLTSDTVDAAHLATGYTAHDASGALVTGTLDSVTGSAYQDADGYIVLDDESGSSPAPSPSGSISDPIRFFDYDGTLVASYTSVPDSLPSVPTHSKLTNGTWNYTLAQVTTQFDAMGTCDVGANYDTASGKNEIDVTLDSEHLEPWLCIAVNGTATVDWGDGSPTETLTGTSFTTLKFLQHVYSQAGDYTIGIDGAVGFYSNSSAYPSVLRPTDDNSTSRRYDRAYCGCVTAVRVADGSRIGTNAFNSCYSLASVSIPDGVTSIGTNAFNSCYSLASVSIPDGVTSIGTNAFYNCYSLASVSIPDGVTSIGASAFSSCYSLASVSIPDGVTSIGANAFSSCFSLASVSIPDGVTSIGASAFSNCFSLASVSIPDGVTSIGANAFYNCFSLASVSIPDGVTSIGTNAFSSCYSVLEYRLLPTTPPTLAATNAFSGIVAGTVIYVPQGCLEAYQAATNWSTYASYMQEES